MPFDMLGMKFFKKLINYFSIFELALWLTSLAVITLFFFVFDGKGYLAFSASLIGATSLIFCAKGNPIGQALIIVFSTLYAIISFDCAYYGEMLTYAGMTLPMAIIALITWLKNPYKGNHSQVKVGKVGGKEFGFAIILTAIVTTTFYFVLKYFHTANLLVSTISVATSFMAVYLTFRRSPYYAVAYGLNDLVLITLWSMELVNNVSIISVLMCFITFLANDIYGFINWKRMSRKQNI